MKCTDIHNCLNAYVDNELGPNNRELIEQHLGECNVCFAQVEKLKSLKEQISQVVSSGTSLSTSFDATLYQRINRTNEKKRARQLLPIAASVALVVSLLSFMTIQSPVSIEHDFIVELQSIGKAEDLNDEYFHQWTQLDSQSEGLDCNETRPGSYCVDFYTDFTGN